MSLSSFQRFTVSISQRVRRGITLLGNWLMCSPRLYDWFYPPIEADQEEELEEIDPESLAKSSPVDEYREFNSNYFADLHEQERMLADWRRMAFYHEAIARHIKPGDKVIDLGTGTGILAAFASRQGAAHVHAIDHSSIIGHAIALAEENGIENIEFEDVHSTKLHLEEKVDVILHEQIGDYLFDEAIVANVCDLRDRLLKPGGLILPSQFELFCEPMTLHDDKRVPYIWELTDVHGFDFSSMEQRCIESAGYYRLVSCELGYVKHFCGEPAPLMEVDLHTVTETSLPLSVKFKRTVVNPGIVDGLVVFMKAKVDDDLVLSSSPLDPERAPHWGFRILRLDQRHAEQGDELEVTLDVEDWSNPDTWKWTCEYPAAGS